MSENYYSKKYLINSYNINPLKNLGLFGTLQFLEDIAGLHADELGLGYQQMVEQDAFWVLTRQKLQMKKWPKWKDEIEIRTWSREPKGLSAFRDYEILNNNEVIGECTTSWMVLDGVERRPMKINRTPEQLNSRKEDECLKISTEKVIFKNDPMNVIKFTVRNSDLDMNLHVNNTKYAQWALNSIPFDKHRTMQLVSYDINFLGEAYLNDEINVQIYVEDGVERPKEKHVFVRGIRIHDDKPIFSSRLIAQEK